MVMIWHGQEPKLYIQRDGYAYVAHKTPGELAGMEVSNPELVDGWWRCRAKVLVRRGGNPDAPVDVYSYPGRAKDSAKKDNAMEMAVKAAESHALRRAFHISGAPSLDEVQALGEDQPNGQQSNTQARKEHKSPDKPLAEWSMRELVAECRKQKLDEAGKSKAQLVEMLTSNG